MQCCLPITLVRLGLVCDFPGAGRHIVLWWMSRDLKGRGSMPICSHVSFEEAASGLGLKLFPTSSTCQQRHQTGLQTHRSRLLDNSAKKGISFNSSLIASLIQTTTKAGYILLKTLTQICNRWKILCPWVPLMRLPGSRPFWAASFKTALNSPTSWKRKEPKERHSWWISRGR